MNSLPVFIFRYGGDLWWLIVRDVVHRLETTTLIAGLVITCLVNLLAVQQKEVISVGVVVLLYMVGTITVRIVQGVGGI